MILVELLAEDYTRAREIPTVTTPTIFRKNYSSITKAKEAAAGDYRKREKSKTAKITWEKDCNSLTSGDLRYICYTISKVKVL